MRSERTAISGTQGGFTLVELLVAFTLLSLIALLLFGALRFGTRVWDNAIERNEAGDEIRIVQQLVRRQLERSVAKLPSDPGQKTADLFRGDSDTVAFVAPLPAQFGNGGFYRQALFTGADEEGTHLVLSWQPVGDEISNPSDLAAGDSRSLLKGLATVEFAYFDPGGRNREPGWRADWTGKRLPTLVRLRIGFQDDTRRDWPDLILPLQLAIGS